MFLSKITGYIVDKYRGGSRNVAVSKVQAGANDYTAQHCFAPGIEINPADGENLIITPINGSSSYMVTVGGTNQDIEPDTAKGERKIYSVSEDGKTIKAIAKFKNNGVLELNRATDSAVLFSELKASFDSLKGTLNDLIAKYNTHIHITTATVGSSGTPGVISPTVASETPSTVTIDGAESADIKLS